VFAVFVVLQVDDLIATGGTLRAGINLMGELLAAEALRWYHC
jgi:adenine/guanine phosphoribosyltransferase-like PRPP-binding protein